MKFIESFNRGLVYLQGRIYKVKKSTCLIFSRTLCIQFFPYSILIYPSLSYSFILFFYLILLSYYILFYPNISDSILIYPIYPSTYYAILFYPILSRSWTIQVPSPMRAGVVSRPEYRYEKSSLTSLTCGGWTWSTEHPETSPQTCESPHLELNFVNNVKRQKTFIFLTS